MAKRDCRVGSGASLWAWEVLRVDGLPTPDDLVDLVRFLNELKFSEKFALSLRNSKEFRLAARNSSTTKKPVLY